MILKIRNKKISSTVFSLFFTIIICTLCFLLKPTLLIYIEAKSEYIKYTTTRQSISNINIFDFIILNKNNNCEQLKDCYINNATIEPGVGSEITYRYNGENLSIHIDSTIQGKSYLIFQDLNKVELPLSVTLISKNKGNEIAKYIHLPIAGPGEIGVEYGSQSVSTSHKKNNNLLLGGQIKIYGKGIDFLSRNNISKLYPIKDGYYDLPIGGRLLSGDNKGYTGKDSLYGIALLDEKYLSISVTTESNELQLYRTGKSSDSETIGANIFSQLFNDPRIAWISIILVSFTIGSHIFDFLCDYKENSIFIKQKDNL